jgi:hypothetical protein
MHTKFRSGSLKGRGNSEDIGVDRKMILDWILRKYGGKVCTGHIWLRIGTNGMNTVMNLCVL